MIEFKKMWQDVAKMVSDTEFQEEMSIIEEYNDGFIIEDNGKNSFVNKEDFINVWCKMLYYNEISQSQITESDDLNQKYVYKVIEKLPYISCESGTLKLME